MLLDKRMDYAQHIRHLLHLIHHKAPNVRITFDNIRKTLRPGLKRTANIWL